MKKRDIATLILLILILAFPYWVYLPALLLAILFLPMYWEGIFLGFLIDVFYGARAHPGLSLSYPYALGVLLLILVLIPLREHLRFDA
ncbi:MAG: hypothetical protein JWN89_74 [Parcubacteria group bacterium]|nr:hypothetical protein [Parcubacteria group bacterium]